MRRSLLKQLILVGMAGLASASPTLAGDDFSRAYAADMLADSASRTSALTSAADPAPLKVVGNFQTRYYANFGSDKGSSSSAKDFVNGFQMRRVRLGVQGQIYSPQWGYQIQGEFNRGTGNFGLAEAYGEYKADNGYSVRFGQLKAPLTREWLVSHNYQLAVERSTVNTIFFSDYVQGVQLAYAGDSIRATGQFNDGLRSGNTDFDSGSEADYGLTGRLEYKWAGDWKQFDQFTSWRGSKFGGMVGGAIHWQDGGSTFADNAAGRTANSSVLEYTLDVSLVGDGWNGFASFVGRHTKDSTANTDFDDFGLVVQGGWFFTDQLEGFGRYSGVFIDSSRTNDKAFNEFTVGVNYYVVPQSHAAKFSADFTFAPNKQSESSGLVSSSTGTGLVSARKGQYYLRAQMQLMF